jgi:hypothetical protein
MRPCGITSGICVSEVQRIEAQVKAENQRVEAEAQATATRLQAQAAAEAQRVTTEAEVEALHQREQAAKAYKTHPALLRCRSWKPFASSPVRRTPGFTSDLTSICRSNRPLNPIGRGHSDPVLTAENRSPDCDCGSGSRIHVVIEFSISHEQRGIMLKAPRRMLGV